MKREHFLKVTLISMLLLTLVGCGEKKEPLEEILVSHDWGIVSVTDDNLAGLCKTSTIYFGEQGDATIWIPNNYTNVEYRINGSTLDVYYIGLLTMAFDQTGCRGRFLKLLKDTIFNCKYMNDTLLLNYGYDRITLEKIN